MAEEAGRGKNDVVVVCFKTIIFTQTNLSLDTWLNETLEIDLGVADYLELLFNETKKFALNGAFDDKKLQLVLSYAEFASGPMEPAGANISFSTLSLLFNFR